MSEFQLRALGESRYETYRQPGDPVKPLATVPCKTKGCSRPIYSNKLCKAHADMAYYKNQGKKK